MEPKKKKKIWLIICLIALVAILITTIIIVVVNSRNNNIESNQNKASNTSSVVNITNSLNDAIINQEIPIEYNGTYEYNKVAYLSFNFEKTNWDSTTQEEFKKSYYEKYGTHDFNGLMRYVNNKKTSELNGESEKIIFESGNYIKMLGTNITENGKYVGNEDLTLVTLINSKNTFFISLNYKVPTTAQSISVTSNEVIDLTTVYVFRTIKNENSRVSIDIVYEYKLIPTQSQISQTDLDLEI
ncbi:MAG: hypothetical protein IJ538_04720 [Clostridia bacterium]|nr:hypothetical protein [Clostridia bacterium]